MDSKISLVQCALTQVNGEHSASVPQELHATLQVMQSCLAKQEMQLESCKGSILASSAKLGQAVNKLAGMNSHTQGRVVEIEGKATEARDAVPKISAEVQQLRAEVAQVNQRIQNLSREQGGTHDQLAQMLGGFNTVQSMLGHVVRAGPPQIPSML